MYSVIKRFLDVFFSIVLLIIISPLLIVISLLIKLTSTGPVIFKQERLGKDGREFNIYKFRTMVENAEKMGTGVYSYEGDPRITKIGSLLRKTSLDELPQLVNIFKGEMSFIGPRPTLTYHPYKFHEYTDFQRQRFDVKPGVTGLAQVNGRKELPWEERIKLDVTYKENMTFILDVKIFFKTAYKVIFMKDNHNVEETGDRHDESS